MIVIVKDENVLYKIIARCQGNNIKIVSSHIKAWYESEKDISTLVDLCVKNNFGCADCLIVLKDENFVYPSKEDAIDTFSEDFIKRFVGTYNNITFCPIFETGSVPNMKIIKIKE